jgi:hypothetical protein
MSLRPRRIDWTWAARFTYPAANAAAVALFALAALGVAVLFVSLRGGVAAVSRAPPPRARPARRRFAAGPFRGLRR